VAGDGMTAVLLARDGGVPEIGPEILFGGTNGAGTGEVEIGTEPIGGFAANGTPVARGGMAAVLRGADGVRLGPNRSGL